MNGKRKFFIVAGALLAAVALCAVGRLSGGEFVTIAVTGITAFSAANAWEHHTTKGK